RPKGRAAPFAIAVVVLMMPPAPTGYQPPPYPGRAEAVAGQPAVGENFRAHLIASPFGTIHAATFSFPQPVGTGVPSSALPMTAYTAGSRPAFARSRPAPPPYPPPYAGEGREGGPGREFPAINRGLKGPRLVPRVRPDFDSPQPSTIEGPDPSPGQSIVRPPP